MDDPRLLVSRPFRAVHFLLGLGWPDVAPLPASTLVASLQALGMSATAARGTLLRLRRAGALAARPAGRGAIYELTPPAKRLTGEVLRRATEDPPPWDGIFRAALVDVPLRARAYREVLKRRAAYAGFGLLRPSLLIAPYEASWSALEPTLASAPDRTWITRAELRLSEADARRAARDVWDLDALAAALRKETKRMSAIAAAYATKPRSGRRALIDLWKTIADFFLLFSVQPPLPLELLPEDWPIGEARAAFAQIAERVAPHALAYLGAMSEGSETGRV
jgi:phenylacetic acid degradation operon negative regulatory protein